MLLISVMILEDSIEDLFLYATCDICEILKVVMSIASHAKYCSFNL